MGYGEYEATLDGGDKLHYFCFSFFGDNNTINSCEAGYKFPKITMAAIKERRRQAGVGDNAVLISVSYIGRMTKKEFRGD